MVTRSQSRKKRKYFEDEQEDYIELLPGLPDDVTVQLISTKRPWRTFHVLPSVSRAWLGAIRSGKINDARVPSRTTETLVVIDMEGSIQDLHRGNSIVLYSLRDKAFYRLPPHPRFEHAIPECCTYITMHEKIYMLGGILEAEVWVLDVAAPKKWQECANVPTPRREFVYAVFESNVYIFGGWKVLNGGKHPIDSSEVYDPKVDAWTKISPMTIARFNFDVGVVRDEILVRGGYVYGSGFYRTDSMEAYNPAKDLWRSIPPGDFGKDEFRPNRGKLFTARGRLHSSTQRKIVVFDFDKVSVKDLHTCSVDKIRGIKFKRIHVPLKLAPISAVRDVFGRKEF